MNIREQHCETKSDDIISAFVKKADQMSSKGYLNTAELKRPTEHNNTSYISELLNFNSWGLNQNGWYFADDIFKYAFFK